MSRLECVGSSKVPQKQVAPALLETHMPKAVGAKYFTAAPRSSLPTQAASNPMKVTNVLCAGGVNNISVGFAGPPVILSQDLKMKDNKKPQQSASAVTGGRVFVQPQAQTTPCSVYVHPPAEPLPPLEPEGEEEHTEEEDDDNGEADDDEEEGYRAPLELMAEFLKSVMEKDFVLAEKLCQMILVYEPNNPEAKQFIPLIQERLEREQEEKSQDDDDACSDSGDEDDSGSDQDSPQSSDSSSSSSSSSSSDEEEEQERRHKPCPPSHLSP
ncbi:glutamate-rich protein 2 isoform X2 [Oncorhynchus tshawytscha]|uniref:glutamate-rich protein 2 isoform X2 n=1 Tax=Oncorhynchus tshawytscha TaxID=74940 RepID=UPI000D09EE9F|nr:glutamate-rich protein 2 isoform X2 [Oncorhynchus tshawytscha]